MPKSEAVVRLHWPWMSYLNTFLLLKLWNRLLMI